MAGHRIGITYNRSSRLGKDTKVAKKKLKWTENHIPVFCFFAVVNIYRLQILLLLEHFMQSFRDF